MTAPKKLTVEIATFSYKYDDFEGACGRMHEPGGGFVFDCRCLPNPGREERFVKKTGLDTDVRAYLEAEPSVGKFLSHAEALLELAVENALSRGYTILSAAFGCTGGQHRSVYCAERSTDALRKKFGARIDVRLKHIGLDRVSKRGFPPYDEKGGAA